MSKLSQTVTSVEYRFIVYLQLLVQDIKKLDGIHTDQKECIMGVTLQIKELTLCIVKLNDT